MVELREKRSRAPRIRRHLVCRRDPRGVRLELVGREEFWRTFGY
jgi:hypothetical protein